MLVLASACVAKAVSWSGPGEAISPSKSGATRVDRDSGANNKEDANQFGNDEAYNSAKGNNDRETDEKPHYWTLDTYGLMDDYGRDERYLFCRSSTKQKFALIAGW